MVSTFLAITSNLEQIEERKVNKFVRTFQKKNKEDDVNKIDQSVLMKIFTNYMQILSCLGQFDLQMPQVFAYMPASPIQSTMFSFECSMKNLFTGIPLMYTKIIVS
jgi:hypothetical protein